MRDQYLIPPHVINFLGALENIIDDRITRGPPEPSGVPELEERLKESEEMRELWKREHDLLFQENEKLKQATTPPSTLEPVLGWLALARDKTKRAQEQVTDTLEISRADYDNSRRQIETMINENGQMHSELSGVRADRDDTGRQLQAAEKHVKDLQKRLTKHGAVYRDFWKSKRDKMLAAGVDINAHEEVKHYLESTESDYVTLLKKYNEIKAHLESTEDRWDETLAAQLKGVEASYVTLVERYDERGEQLEKAEATLNVWIKETSDVTQRCGDAENALEKSKRRNFNAIMTMRNALNNIKNGLPQMAIDRLREAVTEKDD